MAETFTPITTTNLSNQSSITAAIDSNFAALATLLNDVLSRSGHAPNTMANNLDMNSNQILNLPAPVSATSPARLQDVVATGVTFNSVPPVGTSGATVPLLNSNSTYSGSNSFTGNNSFSGNNTFSGTNTFSGPASLTVPVLTSPVLTNATVTGSLTATGLVTNADLVNSSVRIRGVSTPLGGSYLPALSYSNPTNPTATTSTTAVMAGLGQSVTPVTTGNVLVFISFNGWNSTSSDQANFQIAYGTGTAPSNGDAATGTLIGSVLTTNNTVSSSVTLIGRMSGLAVSTAYWIDLQYYCTTGGTTHISNPTVLIVEL